MAMELKTEHLFDAHFDLAPPPEFMMMGKGGRGTRCMVPVSSGTIQGPRIKGTLRFGADWPLIREDNAFIADVRMIIETDDGALIYMEYDGILSLSDEEMKKVLLGEFPPVSWAHTTPRFETGHEKYLWLNKVRAAAIGKLISDKGALYVDYSVYALV
jgi:hypothetical protein